MIRVIIIIVNNDYPYFISSRVFSYCFHVFTYYIMSTMWRFNGFKPHGYISTLFSLFKRAGEHIARYLGQQKALSSSGVV